MSTLSVPCFDAPPMPTQLLDFIRYLGHARSQERHDRQVADELEWSRARARPELPPGLGLRWLGTSGFVLDYQGYTLLIDPYVSRVPMRVALGRTPARPDPDRVDRHVPRADAILLGHTHFDHAMDTPVIARRDGCRVYGSRSAAELMRGAGLGEQVVEVCVYREYELGPFRVRFVPSVHSKLALGLAVPGRGDITCEHVDGMACAGYRCGQVYGVHVEVAGLRLYHQGSADLIDEAIRDHGVDIFLAGIAGRGFTRDYTGRALRALRPRWVLPHHYDDFFVDLDAPQKFSLNVNLSAFVDEVRAVSRDIGLVTATPGRRLTGDRS